MNNLPLAQVGLPSQLDENGLSETHPLFSLDGLQTVVRFLSGKKSEKMKNHAFIYKEHLGKKVKK